MNSILHFCTLLLSYAALVNTNPISQSLNRAPINKVVIENDTLSVASIREESFFVGKLETENAQAVKNVILTFTINGTIANTTTSDASGRYAANITPSGTYLLTPKKLTTEDKYSGISTFDIARINRHLLGIDTFTSPYQYIAADIDRNGEVDVIDVLLLRNFILRKTPDLPVSSWRFIPKSYVFKNSSNPLAENFPETITVSPQQGWDGNFIAVKMGDVNNTYSFN